MQEKIEEKKKNKGGRPPVGSIYQFKPEYCDRIVELGKQGGTIAMFCAELGIYKEIYYQWIQKYPEFADADKRHRAAWEAFSDRVGLEAQDGKIKNFQPVVWIWNRKNKLKERDRHDLVTTQVPTPVIVELPSGDQIALTTKTMSTDENQTS